jgi:hypothetical protein
LFSLYLQEKETTDSAITELEAMLWILRVLLRPGEIQKMKRNERLLEDIGDVLNDTTGHLQTTEISFRWLGVILDDRILANPMNISETELVSEFGSYLERVNRTFGV